MYEIIRLLLPLQVRVVAFLNPTLPGRKEVSWNKIEQSLAALSSLPIRLDRISGVVFHGTLTQTDLPVDASLSVQSCGFPLASFPPVLTAKQLPSDRGCLRLAPQRSCLLLHPLLLSLNHVQRTFAPASRDAILLDWSLPATKRARAGLGAFKNAKRRLYSRLDFLTVPLLTQ